MIKYSERKVRKPATTLAHTTVIIAANMYTGAYLSRLSI